MTPNAAAGDPFESGFDADDDFGPSPTPNDPWRETPMTLEEGDETRRQALSADPFADLPPSRPTQDREDLELDDTVPSTAIDELSVEPPPPPAPMTDLFAGSSAALGEAMVPRITIHAFCVQSDLADAIKTAASDRRMERAQTVVRPGGLAGAVEHYQNQPTPQLVIVESLDPAPVLLDLLGSLAEVCDPGTKVIVI